MRVFAHHYYTRCLITQVDIQRTDGGSGAIKVTYTSLRAGASADITFTDPVDMGTYWYEGGVINEPETDYWIGGHTPIYVYRDKLDPQFTLEAGINTFKRTYRMCMDQKNTTAKADFDEVGDVLKRPDGFEEIQRSHVEGWANVWANGYISVEGDLQLAKVITGCYYYLFSSLPSLNTSSPANQFYGLSPGGLATTDYNGHTFWDMDTWMYPGILMFQPEQGRQMLSYRIYGLRVAERRAKQGGYLGARYPWESAFTTEEVCPAAPYGNNEQHITGDIAFAARQYVSATRDVNWLNNQKGFDLIKEIAAFWFSRPDSYNKTEDVYNINGVMPPDEFHQKVNNSIFTNIQAALSIFFARYAACLSGRNASEEVPDEWINLAQRLKLTFNKEKGYHEEFEGYDKLTGRDAIIKQADVVLLGYPLMWQMPIDVRQRDLEIYENVTDPGGPAMTWGMHAVGWLECGNAEKAERLFNQSYTLYKTEPFKVWTETRGGGGAVNFLTGIGGFLQGILSGYGGLRLKVEKLVFLKPQPLPGTNTLTFNSLTYLGNSLNVNITHKMVFVTNVEPNSEYPLLLTIDGKSQELLQGKTVSIKSGTTFSISTSTKTNCKLPIDHINQTISKTITSAKGKLRTLLRMRISSL